MCRSEGFRKVFIYSFVMGMSIFFARNAPAVTQDDQSAASMDKARADYKVLLAKLQEMNTQYKDITGKIAKVAKEEGIPTIDERTGQFVIKKMDLTQPQPATDACNARIEDADKVMTVSVDLPGLKKDSIHIGIEDVKSLHIRGERKMGSDVIQIDQRVALPAAAESKGTEARYEDGVLIVKVPKAKQQEIKVPVK